MKHLPIREISGEHFGGDTALLLRARTCHDFECDQTFTCARFLYSARLDRNVRYKDATINCGVQLCAKDPTPELHKPKSR
jgi:hypothetical protein